jgi:hypothetical protein
MQANFSNNTQLKNKHMDMRTAVPNLATQGPAVPIRNSSLVSMNPLLSCLPSLDTDASHPPPQPPPKPKNVTLELPPLSPMETPSGEEILLSNPKGSRIPSPDGKAYSLVKSTSTPFSKTATSPKQIEVTSPSRIKHDVERSPTIEKPVPHPGYGGYVDPSTSTMYTSLSVPSILSKALPPIPSKSAGTYVPPRPIHIETRSIMDSQSPPVSPEPLGSPTRKGHRRDRSVDEQKSQYYNVSQSSSSMRRSRSQPRLSDYQSASSSKSSSLLSDDGDREKSESKLSLKGVLETFLSPRHKKLEISAPTDFKHEVHVGYDPATGEFTGLPEEWKVLLANAGISKQEQMKHPQAILKVLDFYTDDKKQENAVWEKFRRTTLTEKPDLVSISKQLASGDVQPPQPPSSSPSSRARRELQQQRLSTQYRPGALYRNEPLESSKKGPPPVAPRPQHTLSIMSMDVPKESSGYALKIDQKEERQSILQRAKKIQDKVVIPPSMKSAIPKPGIGAKTKPTHAPPIHGPESSEKVAIMPHPIPPVLDEMNKATKPKRILRECTADNILENLSKFHVLIEISDPILVYFESRKCL